MPVLDPDAAPAQPYRPLVHVVVDRKTGGALAVARPARRLAGGVEAGEIGISSVPPGRSAPAIFRSLRPAPASAYRARSDGRNLRARPARRSMQTQTWPSRHWLDRSWRRLREGLTACGAGTATDHRLDQSSTSGSMPIACPLTRTAKTPTSSLEPSRPSSRRFFRCDRDGVLAAIESARFRRHEAAEPGRSRGLRPRARSAGIFRLRPSGGCYRSPASSRSRAPGRRPNRSRPHRAARR